MGSVVLSLPNSIQNDRLIKENAQLRQKMESLKELYFENQRLKKLLAFKQDSVFKLVASRVIGRLPDNWSSGVIIDKGSFSGIRRGMPVITYDCLVGRVAEVEKFFSKVTLITDPGLGVSALIQRSRQEGLVCGTLGLYLMMKYLPQDADAQEGDLVVTSGLNSQYPKGISIGKVSYIAKDSSGLSSYCLITPERNLSRIEEVMVVLQ
jgi:rod shape-determining protein MreC